ncbi:TetR family transcriptional regulator [Mycobacteroides chelonae]|jgi:AcrR family transcriptional regulator|uniref:TetR family transcriptional regulator n=1 Tax=Mycobacteroides chelonae TaxID=1774 RepID=A0AB73N8B2_MYCCH|nr:TetR family transcriptional regulator [Mycobacteroides chelonae]MBF9329421.1 TetR/AcrR family transcriptional regulator [Mycobacteroides chelonae]MBF9424112.1 TetR/AcrR family transcriptional regulator [Mycobacteroides chelonae]MBF9437717.1 TetR/AcrR family transcriptional regulator [Mycobacteroides chelonae]MBV6359014.1 TetR family transcriptional regulator [Mycobacteroides chelonae]MEC4835375.1 TetR family transcriptional regulator [Mycobacteroides chelonae]
MTFRRARSEEQREVRRQAILETASSMLSDMPVSQISLNELSRRTGLAKSAMVRYFESREAVLLELLDASLRCWVTEIVAELSCDTRSGSAQERVDHLAALLSRSLRQHPVLCDLMTAQPGVLEYNVSPETLLCFRRSAHNTIAMYTDAIRDFIPELGDDARSVSLSTVVTSAALWMYAQPSASAVAACEAEPELADISLNFDDDLETMLARLITGALVKRSS